MRKTNNSNGIKEIVYIDDKYKNTEADIASKKC